MVQAKVRVKVKGAGSRSRGVKQLHLPLTPFTALFEISFTKLINLEPTFAKFSENSGCDSWGSLSGL